MKLLCDKDCNHCPLTKHRNSRLLSKILNELYYEFGSGVYKIIEKNCPNMTVCPICHIDDFCHKEGCIIRK